MYMRVVPKVVNIPTLFMDTINRGGSPSKLERQERYEEDDKESVHKFECSSGL